MLRALWIIPGVRLGLVEQERVEVAAVAEQRLRRHRGQQVREIGELARGGDREARERAHERGPVGQRQPLLGLERERLESELGQHLGSPRDLAARTRPGRRR